MRTQLHTASVTRAARRAVGLMSAAVLAITLASCGRAPVTAPGASTHAARGAVSVSSDIVVTLSPDADPYQVALDHNAELVTVQYGVATLRPLSGDPADVLLSQIRTDRRIVTSEPDADVEPAEAQQRTIAFDDGFGSALTYGEQASGSTIGLFSAHLASLGDGVPVAILDTGADLGHPALAGHIAGGYDFVDHDANPTDVRSFVDTNYNGTIDESYGHGTHVAGIVALVAPRARLLIVRVLDANGRGDVQSVAAGIRWAVAQGARVINMSLGMTTTSPAIDAALALAAKNSVVCVASAGNWGASSPEDYPARSPYVIAVAAVDAEHRIASFSSYGGFVALAAPGVSVRSAYPGGDYRLWSGTSMSAAFVSGTAALLLADHRPWFASDVLQRLASTASPVLGAGSNLALFGAGVLNAGSALAPDLGPGGAIGSESAPILH
jgi:subtilisin family serine protease